LILCLHLTASSYGELSDPLRPPCVNLIWH
jgi:hypothetical protein